MTIPEKAVEWAVNIANSNAHGYDQASRWGPDYDCSSLIISAYKQAGVPLTCTYTGNMRSNMLANGFRDATGSVLLTRGDGLKVGDVLLNERYHTAMYIGGGQIVHAAGNEKGGAVGGMTGDQTGGEICVRSYYYSTSCPWEYVLRYEKPSIVDGDGDEAPKFGTYTVQPGDSLWRIAEKVYGNGAAYPIIVNANGLSDYTIHPGQVLKTPKIGEEPEPESVNVNLPVLAYGDTGFSVRALQAVLRAKGYELDIDGDFGSITLDRLKAFQNSSDLSVTGTTDKKTWESLMR